MTTGAPLGDGLPVVALAASPGTSARAVPLLEVVGRWAQVVSWQRRGDVVPDALLATTLEALDGARTAHGDRPSAAWVRTAAELATATRAGVACTLTAKPELVEAGALLVPPVGLEVDRWPVVAPLVRRRIREARGLPEHQVVRPAPSAVHGATAADVDDEVVEQLRSCAAAVVGGPSTLVALALGAPVVTSADTARRLGLRAGRDVEVAGSPDAALALAHEIAVDEARAALLSRRGRRCAEHHLDLGRPARSVAAALGIRHEPEDPFGRLASALDHLHTPAGASVRARTEVALAGLGGGGGGSHP